MDSLAFDDLSDSEWSTLQDALATLTFPIDMVWLDGYLVGLVLQAHRPEWAAWAPKAMGAAPSDPLIQTLSERRMGHLSAALDQKAWWDPFLRAQQPDTNDGPVAEALSEALMPWAAGLEQALYDFPIEACEQNPNLMLVLARVYRHLPAPDEHEQEVVELLNNAYPLTTLEDAVDELTACIGELWDLTRSPAAGG
jgi:hypothetical protein